MQTPLDPSFFPRYDALKEEALAYRGVESSLEDARKALKREQSKLAQAEADLRYLDGFAREQRDRIQLVGTHWFYGSTALQPQLWFRGGTRGKISRALAKLERAEAARPSIEESIATLKADTIPPLLADVARLSHDKAQKDFLNDCRDQMHEFAVATHPSASLVSMQEQAESLRGVIAAGTSDLAALDRAADFCVRAQYHYTRAQEHLSEAKELRANLRRECGGRSYGGWQNIRPCSSSGCSFMVTSPASLHCCGRCARFPNQHGPRCERRPVSNVRPCSSSGCGFAASPASDRCCRRCAQSPNEHGQRCGRQPVDTEEEVRRREAAAGAEERRNYNICKSKSEFGRGAELLRSAFDAIPLAVRNKYPALCHPLENASSRTFQSTRALGLDNMGTEQLGCVHTLQSQLQQDKHAAEMTLKSTDVSIDAEKERILTELRLVSSSSYDAAAGPMPMAVAYPMPSAPPYEK